MTTYPQHGILTNTQQKKLKNLWFVYGNNHKKHTSGNHKFIQRLLEENAIDYRKFYNPTQECLKAVDDVLRK